MGRHYLQHVFAPTAIAVFGAEASAASVGWQVCANLKAAGFAGPVYAIGDFASWDAVGGPVDLAVIASPAAEVPGLLRVCGEHQVKAAILLSSDFSTGSEAGKALERAMLAEARRFGVRVLGPNGLGLVRPALGLNVTGGNTTARRGPLALVSQSGAICAAILDWADACGIGFSTVVSVGEASDIGLGDILDYLAMDAETRSVLVYMEGAGDARRFMSGLRAAARMKPVVVVKAGRHAEGARAAFTHTGSLAGADDVFNAALERAGAVRANTIGQMFAAARLLSTACRLHGERLAVVTNAGGPGVMATDWAVEQGIALAALAPASVQALDAALSAGWSRGNPLDIDGEAGPADYQAAMEVCLHDEAVDGVLVMLAPQAAAQPEATAEAVVQAANPRRKPVLACWLGGSQVAKARQVFDQHHIPSFVSPESAVEAFGFLAAYRRNQQLLRQMPGPLAEPGPPDIAGARLVIEGVLEEKRSLLSFLETRALLQAFAIPTLPALAAHSPNEALAAAECLGFPLAMKILSPDISHKTEVGGIRLNIRDAQSVRRDYVELLEQVRALRPEARLEGVSVERMYERPHGRELLAGVLDDPLFGPVLCFGTGGTAAEVLRDRAVALPPLNAHLARAMIAQTRAAKLLGPWRHFPAAKREAIVSVLLRLSAMVCELPQIKELDINPLVADEDGVWALDARIVVRPLAPERRPYNHMAIHPYPSHLESRCQLACGTEISFRPIRPEDAEMEQAFIRGLSPEARYFRFMDTLRELSRDELIRLTQLDYARDLAFVATLQQEGREVEVGVARYFADPDGQNGEFALVVADAWQNKGIGGKLMGCLVDAARRQNFRSLAGEVLANNVKMLRLMDKLGFSRQAKVGEPGVVWVVKTL